MVATAGLVDTRHHHSVCDHESSRFFNPEWHADQLLFTETRSRPCLGCPARPSPGPCLGSLTLGHSRSLPYRKGNCDRHRAGDLPAGTQLSGRIQATGLRGGGTDHSPGAFSQRLQIVLVTWQSVLADKGQLRENRECLSHWVLFTHQLYCWCDSVPGSHMIVL